MIDPNSTPRITALLAVVLALSLALPAAAARKKPAAVEEDADVPTDFAEEEEEAPAPKKKAPPPPKAKKVVEEEEEEEAPAPKKKGKAAEWEEEDEAPAPAKKKGKKGAAEEEPAPKKKGKKGADEEEPAPKKKGKAVVEEEEGEEEEPAPPPRKKKGGDDAAAAKRGMGGVSAGGGKLYVVAAAADPVLQLQLQQLAEQAARRIESNVVPRLESALDPDGARTREKKLTESKELAKTALAAIEDLELSTGVEFLTRAMKSAEAAGFHDAFSAWGMLTLSRAAAKLGDGDEGAATQELENLFRLDPRFKPIGTPPADVAPLLKDLAANARAKSTFTLGITTEPPAHVWVNGTYAGVSPVDLKALAPGDHYVTVVHPGYELLQRMVAVGAGSTETIKLKALGNGAEFAAARAGTLARISEDDRVSQLDALLKAVAGGESQDELLFVGLRADGAERVITLVRWLGAGKRIANITELRTGADYKKELEPAIVDVITNEKAAEAIAATGGFRWTRDHTKWTSLGVGGVGVAAGAIFGVLAMSAEDELKVTPQTSDTVATLIASADDKAMIADISFGVGAVGLGIFSYLLLTEPSDAPPPPLSSEEATPSSDPAPREEAPPAEEKKEKPASSDEDPFGSFVPRTLPHSLLPSWVVVEGVR